MCAWQDRHTHHCFFSMSFIPPTGFVFIFFIFFIFPQSFQTMTDAYTSVYSPDMRIISRVAVGETLRVIIRHPLFLFAVIITPHCMSLFLTPLFLRLFHWFQMLISSKCLNVSVEEINQRRLCGTDVYTDDSDIVASKPCHSSH
jgi:hypothetical protein